MIVLGTTSLPSMSACCCSPCDDMMVIHTLASHLLPDAAPDSWLIAQQMLLMRFPSFSFRLFVVVRSATQERQSFAATEEEILLLEEVNILKTMREIKSIMHPACR